MSSQKKWQSVPIDRDTQLEMARQDLRFANDNKIPYAVLAERINESLGTKWDKSHARRFILNADTVRGAIFGNSLPPEHVSLLRQLAAHIRQEVERGLNKAYAPPLEVSFAQATFALDVSSTQGQLLQDSPQLREIMKSALQMTADHILQAYETGIAEERKKPQPF